MRDVQSTQTARFGGDWEDAGLDRIAQFHRDHVVPQHELAYLHYSLPAYDAGRCPATEYGAVIRSSKFRVPADAILVSRLNPRIPRVWAPKSVGPNAVASTEFLIMTPKAPTVRLFLYYLCSSTQFWERMTLAVTGTTGSHQRVNRNDVMRLVIRFPTDSREQRAIAKALSDVDELLGSLEALLAKKRTIKQAAMQALLTGRTRLPGFGENWGTSRIDQLATVDPENLSSGTDPGHTFNYISLEDVDAGRLVGYSSTSFAAAPSRARRVLRRGDVLMSTVRPNLQGHLLFRGQAMNAIGSTGFAVLRPIDGLCDPGFLFAHLFGAVLNAQVDELLTGSNYPAISSSDVKRLEVTCPPTLAEQQAIATVLSDMDIDIGALERRLDKTRAIKQGAIQQLLTGSIRLPIADEGLPADSAGAAPSPCRASRGKTGTLAGPLARETGP